MREIKFRAWDPKEKEMVQVRAPMVLEMYDDAWCVVEYGDEHDCYLNLLASKCGDILMQYTGLKDKNGVEIYEGDVVRDHVGTGTVKYSNENAGFRVSYGDGKAKWFYDYTLKGERESIEVIGNMYKNPELLEES